MKKISGGVVPALTLMILSPLLAEVLPGATRFSSIFVLPVEICVWGGGALLIRFASRKWELPWINILFLALALSVAEEFLIQQTSLAPMVLQIKGVVYARHLGVNYLYLLWALVYESLFVVFLPVCLAELIFPSRKEGTWLNKTGILVVSIFFLLGSYLAWFSWTQIARPKVFHVPAYNPSLFAIVISVAIISILIFVALGPFRKMLTFPAGKLSIPSPVILIGICALCAIVWYGLVILAFGAFPAFPPIIALVTGFLLAALALFFFPRWLKDPNRQRIHLFSIVFGVMLGSMLAGYIGFIGATPADLYFKIITNCMALCGMLILGLNIKKAIP